ncbi:hypothetical protein [uncultured Alistipes sp.]|uniref:hypothetical protein n=1 Tax=uncultured Alistipes sp. TaxID=538949 RepID=UPI0025F2D2D8|nr:hypothetical protein [uncultured Alistipes sp.]
MGERGTYHAPDYPRVLLQGAFRNQRQGHREQGLSCPATERETVAAQLADLAFGYRNKFKCYDAFTRLSAEKSLEYYPQHPKACIILGKSLDAALVKHLKGNGYKEDDYARQIEAQSAALFEKLQALGWEAMSEELYDKLEKGNEEGMKMQEATTK